MLDSMRAWAVGLTAVLVASGCAQAQSNDILEFLSNLVGKSASPAAPPARSSKIRFGEPTAVPSGYYEMCAGHPSLCRSRTGRMAASRDGSVIVTDAAMDRLNSVNASVNAAIQPAYRDAWTPGQPVGDCKDFAMTKRERLIDAGWPSSALPVAIVRTSAGEKHLILVARTNRGDFVLDNLKYAIVPWTSASYSWEKIQSPTDGLAWRAVEMSAL